MVDKKTVAIAVLCVTTVLFLGLWVKADQEAQKLGGVIGELEDDYDKLARVRTSLEENYSELRTEKEDLETEYSDLKRRYDSLKEEYSSLATSHLNWQRMYSEVKDDYDELNSIFEVGEAIAESAEWVSEDERLKVTSKLIPDMWASYLSGYTVRVTITNMGDEPIDKVVIFVFPYEDGKFAETYYGYESHSVENIYIDETYSHDFMWITKDMTSYKVLAVAG